MAVSLRVVIGLSMAVIVLIVAATTLAITYTVSIEAVRDAGERLSMAVTSTVHLQVGRYIGIVDDHLYVSRNVSKLQDTRLPTEDPQYGTYHWGLKFMYMLRGFMMEVGFSYASASLIFDDGSLVVSFPHQLANFEYFAEGVQTWRNMSNGTQYADAVYNMSHVTTMRPWDVATQGPMPPLAHAQDMRVGGYNSVIGFTGGQEACLWFPPGVDHNIIGNPRFILYGVCVLKLADGRTLGQISLGRFMDNMDVFMRGTAKTPNTELFVIDSYRYVVTTSASAPYRTYHEPGTVRVAGGCVSSWDLSRFMPQIIGCRVAAADYPYGPLAEVAESDREFMLTAGEAAKYGKLDGEPYYYLSRRIQSMLTGYSMNLVVFMPESDVLGDIVRGRNIAIGVTAAVFIVAVGFGFLMVGVLVQPIDDVAKRMYFTSKLTSEREVRMARQAAQDRKLLHDHDDDEKEHDGDDADDDSNDGFTSLPDEQFNDSSMAEIRALQHAYKTMDTAIKSFTKYVPRDVVKELMEAGQMCEIQMRPMRCSMLFTDIAGFTSICERVPPHILSTLVRIYFERMSRIVMAHGGVIDKFIGDAIMAVWGAPKPIDYHELRSAVCAKMLAHETTQEPLKGQFEQAGEKLNIRAGVASGEVLAGNMGSRARMSYTVIGDEVNLAARLEGLNKQWGTTVMVSEETAEECAEYLIMRYIISIAVVGKSAPVKVYEVIGVDVDAKLEKFGKGGDAHSSEQQSMSQAQKSAADVELAERYGTNEDLDDLTTPTWSVGRLLRRCKRKIIVDRLERAFVEVYQTAVSLWDKGDFRGAMDALGSIATRGDMPTGASERLSVRNLSEAAAARAAEGTPAGWTGVWTAKEK